MIKTESRDIQVFTAIYQFMESMNGETPKISDLVSILNGTEGMLREGETSVGNGTVSNSLFRLERIGIIAMRRTQGKKRRRSAGSLRINGSSFSIGISLEDATRKIEDFYEQQRPANK